MPRLSRLVALAALATTPCSAFAQTDWYNSDRGRPLRTEDALVLERHAIELQLAPFTFARRGTASSWELTPELAWGVLPRTQFEVGLPLQGRATLGGDAFVAAHGVELALMHALNAETLLIPGLAIGVDMVLPAGGRRAEHAHAALTLIATRTSRLGRAHVNVSTHLGTRDDVASEVSRWRAGLAVDRPLALHSMLLAAELVAEEPLAGGAIGWTAGTGVRWQLSPRLALDAGLARTMSGDARGWSITVGHAYAFALPMLQPTRVR